MKTHSGSINVPGRTCQTLGQIRSQAGWERVTSAELAARVAIERRHDGGTSVAEPPNLDAERDSRAGLCPCCGDLIGNVERCPFCGSPLWMGLEKLKAG